MKAEKESIFEEIEAKKEKLIEALNRFGKENGEEKEEEAYFESTNENKVEKIDSSKIIFLTEKGFSKDVGTFNPKTRVAKLETSLVETVLIIKGNNITLDGNGREIVNVVEPTLIVSEQSKNISIKCIKLKTDTQGIIIEERNENIIIEDCYINAKAFGIIASKSANIKIEKNIIVKSDNGITLKSNCINCSLKCNKILKVGNGIVLYNKNSFIDISENLIYLESDREIQLAIKISNNNSFSKIEKNKIEIEKNKLNIKSEKPYVELIGISIESGFYSSSILNNEILIKSNCINLEGSYGVVNIRGITMGFSCEDVEICGNATVILDNIIDVEKCSIADVGSLNIYTRNNIKLSIYDNEILNWKNEVRYKSIGEYGSIEISNIRFGVENTNINFLNNNLECMYNTIQGEESFENIIERSVSVGLKNEAITIKDNRFKLKVNKLENSNFIICSQENNGIHLIGNELEGRALIGIILSEKNNFCIIEDNLINDTLLGGIVLFKENNQNVIKENKIGNSEIFGIVLLENNESNKICGNLVFKTLLAIIIFGLGNNQNFICDNRFRNNKNNLIVANEEDNFIC